MNTVAAIAIQAMGVFTALMGLSLGLFSTTPNHEVYGAVAIAIGLAGFFSKSGRYRRKL